MEEKNKPVVRLVTPKPPKLKVAINLISGNPDSRNALFLIQKHKAHLKMRFAQNTRKREIEDLFTELKINFLKGITPGASGSLVGPDIPDHKNNNLKWGCTHMIIPEINIPTMTIMLNDPTYLVDTSYIDIIHAEFFNEILRQILKRVYIFSDIDYDGTATFKSMKIPAVQFINELNKYNFGVTSKFTMVFSWCMRDKKYVKEYNDFKNLIMAHVHGMSNFQIDEAHYIDYTGIGSMATAILLVEKIDSTIIKHSMPTLNYYTHFKHNRHSYAGLRNLVKQNSKYIP